METAQISFTQQETYLIRSHILTGKPFSEPHMNNYYPFINTPLPYAYDALEPFIDKKTMHLHHDRHLQTYIDNLNRFLEENPSLQNCSLEKLLTTWRRLPCHLQAPLKNNAGGVYNHRFYFDGMKPSQRTNTPPHDPPRLFHEMTRQFGSPENFRSQFKSAALSVFGSGYAWLVSDNGVLRIVASSNQNTPLRHSRTLLLNIDVWEHAYYLKHYNLRAAYIDDWFHVVNWEKAAERFTAICPDCGCR